MVDAGVASGEIRPGDRDLAVEFVRILLIGLTESGSESPERHRLAIDSNPALLRGEPDRPRGVRTGPPAIAMPELPPESTRFDATRARGEIRWRAKGSSPQSLRRHAGIERSPVSGPGSPGGQDLRPRHMPARSTAPTLRPSIPRRK